jgi:dynein heavy chain
LIHKIKPKVEDPNFEPSIVRRSSVACEAMCKWVHAMYKYYHINKEVEPIRIKVAELNAEVA